MEKTKYFKTIIQIEVLSEDEPISDDMSLENIEYVITEGDCSGVVKIVSKTEMSAEEMSKELINQGSSPDLFRIGKSEEEFEEME